MLAFLQMVDRLAAYLDTFPSGLLVTLAAASVIVFLGTLIVIPFILVRLPENYFDVKAPRTWMQDYPPALRIIGRILKNIVGVLFVAAGISMLVLPGQGVLTILIGLSLVDFPGKQRLEARIIGQRNVLKAVNSLRARFGRGPFVVE